MVSRWFGLVLKRVSRRERIANGTISALVAEGVDNSLAIAADNQGPADRRRVRAQSLEWMRARIAELKAGELYSQAVGLVELFVMLGVLVIGAWMISAGAHHPGRAHCAHRLPWSVVSADPVVGQSRGVHHDSHGKCRAGGAVLDEPIMIADDETDTDRGRRCRRWSHRRCIPPVVSRASFSDVDFAYPDTGTQVFEGFSLHLDAGEFVALVGPSGAGKTSATHLLLRF